MKRKTASLKRIEELRSTKTKLSIEHFSIFKYGHHYSISISKNFSNPTTARREINRITKLLFGKPRYTPEMLKQLEKSSYI